MKKFILLVCLLSLYSCEKRSTQFDNKSISEINPWDIGKLHNEILKELDNSLLNMSGINTIDDYTKKEKEILNGIIPSLTEGKFNTNAHVYEMIETSNRIVYQYQQNSKSHTEANDLLSQKLLLQCDELFLVDDFLSTLNSIEVDILKDVLESFRAYQETKDIEKLKLELTLHKNNLSDADFDNKTSDGFLASMAISIAENSINYWTIDTLTQYDSSSKILWWAVGDAVGAVVSAGGTILKDVLNDDEIDWTNVAIDGLIGGVGASIPGGKGFKKLVKQLF